jgi:hypothetical protein
LALICLLIAMAGDLYATRCMLTDYMLHVNIEQIKNT